MRSTFARPVLLAALTACAPHVHEDDDAQTPADQAGAVSDAEPGAPPTTVGPALAVLVTRDHRVAVHTLDGEPRFTVADRDGAVLAEGLGLWQLARDYPQLHRQYETAFAGEGIELDARVDDLVRECAGCDGDPIGHVGD